MLNEFWASFIKDIKTYSRYPTWVLGDILIAPLWFVLFVLSIYIFSPPTTSVGLSQTLSYFFWGYAFVMLFNSGLAGIGQFMLIEQLSGTLEQVLLAPANRLTLIAGRWVMLMFTDAIIILSTGVFLIATEHVGIEISNPASLALVIGLFEVGLLGLGLMLAGITLRFKGVVPTLNYLWFAVVIFSGVFFPISAFPSPLRELSLLLPTTFYVDMIKHFAVSTPAILDPGLELGLLFLMSVTLLLAGRYVFGVLDRAAKKQGKIGLY